MKATVKRETEKALLISLSACEEFTTWIPKSVCEVVDETTILIDEWKVNQMIEEYAVKTRKNRMVAALEFQSVIG